MAAEVRARLDAGRRTALSDAGGLSEGYAGELLSEIAATRVRPLDR